jgi:integrase
MARPKSAVPGYSRHSSSGQAVVYVNRRRIYLGPHGSPESRQRYAEVISGITAQTSISAPVNPAPTVSINELCLKFATDKMPKLRTPSGARTGELDCFTSVIRLLRELFGETPAEEFGPLRLRTLRAAMIDKDWSRKFINKQCGRVRAVFKFGVGWQLIDESVLRALKAVEALSPGDPKVRETVPLEDIEAAKGRLRQRNRDLVDLMLMTAARPSELLGLTTSAIDRSGDVWFAKLTKHKTAHRGHNRTIHFGDKAQAILLPYIDLAHPDVRLFPIQRKTFGMAVKAACIKAGVTPFTPHWLRHTAVTRFVDEAGAEAAQRVAGHVTSAMTALYSTAATKTARDAVKRLG